MTGRSIRGGGGGETIDQSENDAKEVVGKLRGDQPGIVGKRGAFYKGISWIIRCP